MSLRSFTTSALMSAALAFFVPISGAAESLRVINGAATSALNVPMNRAVVVESDQIFAELSIANSAIADISSLSERTIYVLGKEPGRTTLTLIDESGRLISNVEIHVTPDISEFKERLGQILPGERIEVRTANNGLVLSGQVSSLAKLDAALELAGRYAPDRVSNLMTVGGTQQVMLKVRFAEMQRSVSKSLSASLGVNAGLFGAGNSGVTGGSQNLTSAANRTALQGGSNPSNSNSAGALGFSFGAGNLQVGLMLEALETKGVVRTLAEPNLTALSGQSAYFLAGGEYPVPTTANNGSVSVTYKPFGVEMAFTPRVLDSRRINLEINTSVSAIDSTNGVTTGGLRLDAFKTRKAQTTVELGDGESFAIAGLLQDDFRNSNGQVPWLGDVPVLGALFRSSSYRRAQTELVIVITAHLVTPTSGEALALPTDRVQLPTERELFLNGQVMGRGAPTSGAAAEVARQDFTGSYGYVME